MAPRGPEGSEDPAGRTILYTAGRALSWGGSAGIGVVLCNETGEPVKEISEPIGTASNNVASYRALIRGLEEARVAGWTHVEVRMDNRLIVGHLTGEYKVKFPGLVPFYQRAMKQLGRFQEARVVWVPREQNDRAVQLANAAANQNG